MVYQNSQSEVSNPSTWFFTSALSDFYVLPCAADIWTGVIFYLFFLASVRHSYIFPANQKRRRDRQMEEKEHRAT